MGYSEFKNINTQNTAGTQQVSGSTSASKPQSSSSTSSAPIPVGKNNQIQDRCTQLLQSEEFKNLTDKEKLELLKKDFPKVDEATLKNVLNTAKTTIASDGGANNGIKSIDDMIKALRAKPKNKLTPQEKQLLSMFDKDGNLNIKDNKESKGQFAKTIGQISAQLAKTPGWAEKSASEKLDAVMDVMIGQMIPGYADYPEENKANIRKEILNKIAKSFYDDWDKLSKDTQDLSIQLVAVVLEQLENKQDVDAAADMMANDPDNTKKKGLMQDAMGNILDKYFVDADIDLDKIKNIKDPKKRLEAILYEMLSKICPNISELSPEALEKAKSELTDMIGKVLFKNEWNDENKRPILSQSLVTKMIALKEYNTENVGEKISAKEFFSDVQKKYKVLDAYERSKGIALSDTEMLQRKVILDKGREPITPLDILNYLEKKYAKEGLTDKEAKLYAEYDLLIKELNKHGEKGRQKLNELLNEPLPDVSNTGDYLIRTLYKGDREAWLKDYCAKQGFNIDSDFSKLPKDVKKAILNNIGDYEAMVAIGKLLGYSDVTAIFDELEFVDTTLVILKIDPKNLKTYLKAKAAAANAKDDLTSSVHLETGVEESGKASPKDAAVFVGESIKGRRGKEIATKIPKLQAKYGWPKEHIAETNTIVINDKTIDTDIRGTLLDGTIENAPDDDTRTYYGKHFSQNAKDPDMLEYLGAASRHVQDPAKKEQYNKTVTTAAAKYPPEVQERVAKAIETGEVSPETKAKTASSTTSNSPATKPASKPKQNPTTKDDSKLNQTPAAQTTPTVATAATKTPVVTPAAAKKANDDTTRALTDKKDRVAENILNYQEEVKRDLSAREVQDIKETIVAISQGSIDENLENHMRKIIATNNIETIYKTIANMGVDILQKFISALTSYGSPEKILAFANVVKDDIAMLQSLYTKCSSESVRARILKLMPSSVIYSMIASGQITNLSEIDPSLLYDFLMQNMSSMSLNSISSYLKYLPFEDRESIVAMLNGNDDEVQPEIRNNDALAQNIQPVRTPDQSEQDNAQQNDVQPEIKDNEFTAMRNDGTEIKRKTSFGAVSSTDFSESYEEVTNRTGLSRSAQEEVLTPGSPEWLRKYNKQQDVPPTTAFTMAALEEDDELGMPFGSTKVGMGQKIKKKYPPQSFRFKA